MALPPSQLNPLATAAQYYAYTQCLPEDDDTAHAPAVLLSAVLHQTGAILDLDQAVTSTAIVLFHRYLVLNPTATARSGRHRATAAAAALFTAVKKEPRYTNLALRPVELLAVFNHVFSHPELLFHGQQDTSSSINNSSGGTATEDFTSGVTLPELYEAEMELVAAMSFTTHVVLAYSLALSYIQVLGLNARPPTDASFAQETYALLTTALIAAAPALYTVHQPNTIAATAIYLVAAGRKQPMVEDMEWWRVLDVENEDFGHCLAMVCDALDKLETLKKRPLSDIKELLR